MDDVKAKRVEDGVYELSYKGESTRIIRRPDLYFDLTLDGKAHKGYLKEHKARFGMWVNSKAAGGSSAASEASPATAQATAAPLAPGPRAAPEPPAKPSIHQRLRETPPDGEPGVLLNTAGEPANSYVRSHGAKRQDDTITMYWELYSGRSTRVSMTVAAAIRHIERVEAMINSIQATGEGS